MNILVESWPNHLFITDSCKNGSGVFSLKSGRHFRFELTDYLKSRDSNNFLEYLAKIVAIFVSIVEDEVHPLDCYFSCTDNTSEIGWSFKRNFSGCARAEMKIGDALSREEVSSHLTFSRKLAPLVIDHSMCLHEQHLKGIRNLVANILSRCFHLSEVILNHLLLHFYPSSYPVLSECFPFPERLRRSSLELWNPC